MVGGEQRPLAGLHRGALVGLGVVVPDEVERTVDDQQGDLVVDGAGVARRLITEADVVAPSVAEGVGEPDDVAAVLREVGESFLNYQVVAKREQEQRSDLAERADVLATVPYFDRDIADLGGLLRVGEAIWR